MKNIAVIAGSFDPVTKGHTWVMQRALDVADKLVIVIGHNPAKKYMFTLSERKTLVANALAGEVLDSTSKRFEVVDIGNRLVIDYAAEIGAKFLVRGIRNTEDFAAEHSISMVHQKIQPQIHTAYFIPPNELAEVSSSVVKGLVGFDRWERAVAQYVHPVVMAALQAKAKPHVT